MPPSRADRLAELRAARKAGKTAFSSYEVQDEEQLYETVDEDSYKKIVRKRLDQDDFVVDDNGEGYADDGREDWQNEQRQDYDDESDDDLPARGKAAKRKRDEDEQKKDKINKGISKYFNANPTVAAPKPKPATTAEDAAFMADLLGEVNANIPSYKPRSNLNPIKSESRRKTRVLSPPVQQMSHIPKYDPRTRQADSPPAPVDDDTYFPMDEGLFPPPEDNDVPMSDPMPSSPVAKAAQRKESNVKVEEDEDEDMLEVAQVTNQSSRSTAAINMRGNRPIPKIIKTDYPTPASSSPSRQAPEAIDTSALTNVTDKLNVLSSSGVETVTFGKLDPQHAQEEDGSVRFFWFDYTEINGGLCLFGKVKDKSTGRFVSAFVKVDNIMRKLFFLPREHRRKHGRETDEEVEMGDVYQEVDGLMSKFKVNMHKIKPCSRKYAFELPDIPKEADYLKLLYPYDKQPLPTDLQGETFSHVFGTNTALFEQFVLWKNIMGPCWLKIDAASINFNAVKNASWCKLEMLVDKPQGISTLGDTDNLDAPPLTLMSIALRTKLNEKDNKQEILLASARIYDSMSLSDTTAPEKLPCKTFTVMRPNGPDYPVGFKTDAEKYRGNIQMEKSEGAVLSKFLALLDRNDPDVLIGHRLDDVDYTLLLSRMRECRTPGWHRIGRLKRHEWPKNIGKGGGSFFVERQLAAGRLLCDLGNDMGKSLMTKCQSWSLDEMCDLVLGGENKRRDIDNDVLLKMATNRAGLMQYIKLAEADTFFIAAIALKVQMLPLTKVLTNLAGNSWARTLSGTRAERNEYILLHEFHKNKYICPDKIWGKGKAKSDEDNPEGEEGADAKKKDKFKGGLVFEPEKGLYDKFILVMDFNSLYPSIIQEYNICFTTVERSELNDDEEKVPEVPSDTNNKGILPRLIRTLVHRRREVKKLMKDKTATVDQLATWEIKQMALKLTANSMYGCLGYTKSRFYARPLAMLTTYKGREILQSTKDLAESAHGLRVIYGDTDSVMVNTNVDNIMDAMKIGNDFKKSVNERYELLEIDIDNIFRRLLLHAKKKYAAVNMIEKDGKWIDKLEVKGLDMRRREYCALSKDTSTELLNFLLSGEDPETVVSQIHDHLREVASQMRANTIPLRKYTIYTQLGKNPKEYPNANSMPSVQVALKLMAKGKHVKAKDVMSYIICNDSSGSAESAAKNAFPVDEVLRAENELVPDIDYYLHKQILPPVERLCAPIEGTNVTLLAECLGLDTSKYRVSSTSNTNTYNAETEIHPLESQVPDEIRFKDCAPLGLLCLSCRSPFQFRGLGVLASPDQETPSAKVENDGIHCPAASCGKLMAQISLSAQLESQIRAHTAEYYAATLVCDEATCGNRTRQMSVYGHRCLGPRGLAFGCTGKMHLAYSEKALYNQLLFLSRCFDVDKVVKEQEKKKSEEAERVVVVAEVNRRGFGSMRAVVEGYLDKSGWGWVSMDGLFGFALKALG
ncbi:hypothetical protein AUEXF2481DRAFT_8497 [Aureobasidium subglaciale EXF-2481]|uniref:DNA polymerase n=1 Tax=Aureobasidium subglaciale (strain EXF-2481) TaxID=1043005 RepID=A0A074YX32_AURSE|nr:uncharacterized protein AUEXF2481DRAFT_8497 [Aureobasidium subglaciale EXF-2481]KEQ91426.1 hypothetical protein AUEXF2481DRAFT_8497 [Aureobasidium subglaciale EXF-2481]